MKKKKINWPSSKEIVALIAFASACYAAWDKLQIDSNRSIENREMIIEQKNHNNEHDALDTKFEAWTDGIEKRLDRLENRVFK